MDNKAHVRMTKSISDPHVIHSWTCNIGLLMIELQKDKNRIVVSLSLIFVTALESPESDIG